LGSIVLVGRELYRYGYTTKDGPNSNIREYGAYPLNIAELLCIFAVLLGFSKSRLGGFFSRRKIVRYFTHTKYDIELEKIIINIKKGEDVKRSVTRGPGEFSEQAKRRG
jgi:hypothetical protein